MIRGFIFYYFTFELQIADIIIKSINFRPDVESCNDAPHNGLVSEVNAIQQNVDELNEVNINKIILYFIT